MTRWRLWVRVSTMQTAYTVVYASTAWDALLLGEAQYGKGNVLGYTELVD